ncbi:MAG: hypothetical protein Q4B45_09085 [Coriobacteriia bacterium]|nr:hypothetical protein [Coriobacteriia bacterium]
MRFREELILRCAAARREKIGQMSDAAFNELLLTVRESPDAFVERDAEKAFAALGRAVGRFEDSVRDDDLLDDDEYVAERARRFSALAQACDKALAIDPGCLDARLVRALATQEEPDGLLAELRGLEAEVGGAGAAGGAGAVAGGGAGAKPFEELSWANVFDRPRMRLRAAAARACGDGARWKGARDAAESLLAISEKDGDPLGARYTAALAYARLEDEEGLNALDARFSQGNTWSNLARCLLLYKLDRLPAARRALRGYASLCEGAAYALLRPIFVETYLPDRPDYAPGSFEEALCAVHEAEVIIADTPDFVAWCEGQDWFRAEGEAFAQGRDLDW